MLRNILKSTLRLNEKRRGCSQAAKMVAERQTVLPTRFMTEDGEINEKAVLERIVSGPPDDSRVAQPSFNFAAYADKSDTLQQLVKLGVDLYRIEHQVKAVPFILTLKFDDIRQHIMFLKDVGLGKDEIANVITKNPFIFKEELDNLEVRVNYLEFKQFTKDMVTHILRSNPVWLSHSTQEIDRRLGFFQKTFSLKGDQVRALATKRSKLITYDLAKVKLNLFVMKEEMGFDVTEIRSIILKEPKIFTSGQNRLLKTFEYLHRTMKIPLDRIALTPEILTCRRNRLEPRHQFLVKLGRDQFDPKKPNYVALTTLVAEDDVTFATETAKSSTHEYNLFLKTF
ncbi:transcription termination factor 3, mitochondrial [Cylas formicarius]|uniref:transcription termination factor 3, mitochondrial n=1 Tax=Cylas formicarius TaxID=197179 RepID=UPI0029585EE8|nr:transcription termination factor 3, mitochondrial [Cylas formicarius]